MFKDKKNIVAIWLAAEPDKQVLEKYFHETYGSAKPLNQFARDARDTSYDNDFVENNWAAGRGLPVEKLLKRHSYGESFAAAGAVLARAAGIERANFAFVMYDIELQPAKWPKSSPVQYLGTVPYTVPYTGPQLRADAHQRPVNQAFITPDGKFGLTTSWDAELRLWSLQSGELIAKQVDPGTVLDDGNNRVAIAGAAPRGEILTHRYELIFWKPSTTGLARLRKLKSPHRAGISQAIVDRAGKRLITSSFDKTLAVWNLPEVKPTILTGHAGRVYRVAFLPGGKILSGDDEGEFRVWSLRSGRCLTTIEVPKKPSLTPHLMHVTKDGSRAVVCSYGALGLIDLENGNLSKILHEGSLNHAVVTPDERRIVVAWREGQQAGLQIWDLKTGKLKHTLVGHEGEIRELALSGDGQTAATGGYDANLVLWNLKTGKEIARFHDAPAGRPVPAIWDNDGYTLNAVALNSAGDRVLCGEASGRVRILKLVRKKLVMVSRT